MTFYVDPQGIVRPKLGPRMSTKAPNIPPDLASSRGKIDDIMRASPKGPVGPQVSTPRRAFRAVQGFRPGPVPVGQVGQVMRRGAGPAALLTGAIDFSTAAQGQADRSLEDIEARGGWLASTAKDAFPTLSKAGEWLGEKAGQLIHGPIRAGRFKNVEDEKPATPYFPPPSTDTRQGVGQGVASTTTQAPEVPPVAPAAPANQLVRINRPGSKSKVEYTNIPDQPGYDTGTPIAMPDFSEAREAARAQGAQGQEQGPAPYQSPVAQFMEKNPVPTVDPRRATFGDLMANNMRLNNYRSQLLPSVALQKQMGEQRRRGETDREFELKLHKFDQEGEIAQQTALAELAKMRERSRESALNRAVTMRGQDLRARGGGSTYADQLKEMDAIGELSARYFPDAPPGFASMVPNLAAYGVGLDQIRDTYNQVTAEQMATQRVKSPAELDAQMLLNAVAARLGIAQ